MYKYYTVQSRTCLIINLIGRLYYQLIDPCIKGDLKAKDVKNGAVDQEILKDLKSMISSDEHRALLNGEMILPP